MIVSTFRIKGSILIVKGGLLVIKGHIFIIEGYIYIYIYIYVHTCITKGHILTTKGTIVRITCAFPYSWRRSVGRVRRAFGEVPEERPAHRACGICMCVCNVCMYVM